MNKTGTNKLSAYRALHKTLFSGIQPTGYLHLGNYLGAITLWRDLQNNNSNSGNNSNNNSHDNNKNDNGLLQNQLEGIERDLTRLLFCIVDLHAITASPYSDKEYVFATAAAYIACGIDEKKSIIFVQSQVPQHTELFWLLGCLTPIGWLNRMTQFKEKSGKNKENACLGLYAYPVLMAADILLYKADLVPVGDDQTQHLELTIDIAEKFNRTYNTQYFAPPQILKHKAAPRIMSLRDGLKKMSKSDPSDFSRINLTDSKDLIAAKLKAAKSDSILGFDYENIKERPEAYNLLNILLSLTNKNIEIRGTKGEGSEANSETALKDLCNKVKTFSELKSLVTEALLEELAPIQEKFKLLITDKAYINEILKAAAAKASVLAAKTITEIKDIIGFI